MNYALFSVVSTHVARMARADAVHDAAYSTFVVLRPINTRIDGTTYHVDSLSISIGHVNHDHLHRSSFGEQVRYCILHVAFCRL
jgi:hypothetical protein